MSDTRVHFDGSFDVPELSGEVEPEDMQLTRSRIFRAKYLCTAAAYLATAEDYSLKGPYGTPMYNCPLIETSPARDLGGGIVEFTRTYAQIPPTRTEFEQYGYAYQFVNDVSGDIYELPLSVKSRCVFSYFHTKTPELIETLHAFRIAKVDSTIFYVGTQPGVDDTFLLGEDEKLTRWKGNIYEKMSRYVPVLTPAELA
jgi:hypothetical protein